MWGSIVTAGAGILGGLLDNGQRKRDAYNNSPEGIRKNFEAAGFNPLLGFTGNGNGTGAQYAPTMGSTIANSIAVAQDQRLEERALKIQQSQLEMQNQRLQRDLENAKLRPNVPGIYGDRNAQQRNNSAANNASTPDGILEAAESPAQIVTNPGKPKFIISDPQAAERGEAAYGEIGGEVIGIDSLVSDAYGNYAGHAYDPEWGWESDWPKPKPRPKAPKELKEYVPPMSGGHYQPFFPAF